MTLSNHFKEGMKYPQRIQGNPIKYTFRNYDLSVRKAWSQVGELIRSSMVKVSNERKGK